MTSRGIKVLALSVCLVAGALILEFLPLGLPGGITPVLVLVGLVLVTENFAFNLPLSGSVSLSFAAAFAAMLHSGPLAAMIVSIAASTNLEEARAGKPIVVRIFNAGQLVASAGLSGSVFLWAGGVPLSQASATVSTTLVPAIASALVFYASNVLLVSLAVSMLTNQPYRRVLSQLGFLSYGSSLLVLALLGLLIAHLMSIHSWASLLLLTLPFMAARRTFRVYVELTEAYISTVRSLVTAIEAKDPYTRGHSERVATYAQAIAGHMGLPQSDVQVLERAALLHDVGKIGISLDTLVSPDKLSEDEMRAIRRHPGLGTDLVTDVDFLHDIVDVIRCHHERCDGGGYPDGILGDDIPLLARILAAADSFDAMTSDRAYRPGVPFDEAIDELLRVSGEQLDERVVASFVEVLRSDELGAMAS